MKSVYCAVRTGSLNKAVFKGLKREVYLSILPCLTVVESFVCVSSTSVKVCHKVGTSMFSHNVNQSLPTTFVLQLVPEIFNKSNGFLCLQSIRQ